MVDGKEISTNHPIAFVSGLFHGSQINWAAFTKEAYAIYMTVKKSTFYLTGHDITLRSDHLPLNKFLRQMTLNNTVNNWAVEIENFNINFLHIADKDNILADALNRLIDINPDIVLEPKLKDYEFEHNCFKTLPKATITSVVERLATVDGMDTCEINITHHNHESSEFSVNLPLSNEHFGFFFRRKMRKFSICREKSKMVNMQTFILLKMIFFTDPSWIGVTSLMQQWFLEN